MRGRAILSQYPESAEEYSYLLGLYFADGTLSSKGNCVTLFLQGNEDEIRYRVVRILNNMSMSPKVKMRGTTGKSMICVQGCASNLSSFLPRKKSILNGKADIFRRFVEESDLLYVNRKTLAFLAGLMDGDGSCYVALHKNCNVKYLSSHDIMEIHWTFTAVRHPVLAWYTLYVTRDLLRGSASLSVIDHKGGKMHVVRILNEGIVRLLNHGFLDHCWKARVWSERYNELRHIQKDNSNHSLREVRRLLGVSPELCSKLFRQGFLGGSRIVYATSGGFRRSRCVFSREEFECLREKREEILKSYRGDCQSLRELCKSLHLCPQAGRKLVDAGVIKAERRAYPTGQVRYSIPRDEAVSLLTKVRGRAKRVY